MNGTKNDSAIQSAPEVPDFMLHDKWSNKQKYLGSCVPAENPAHTDQLPAAKTQAGLIKLEGHLCKLVERKNNEITTHRQVTFLENNTTGRPSEDFMNERAGK